MQMCGVVSSINVRPSRYYQSHNALPRKVRQTQRILRLSASEDACRLSGNVITQLPKSSYLHAIGRFFSKVNSVK